MDLASLGIVVQSQGVEKATADLDKLDTKAVVLDKNVEQLIAEVTRLNSTMARTGSQAMRRNTDDTSKSFGNGAISAKQYAAALRLVPAQITDIVTQLAGGQSPFLIAIQQGGQLRDSFGGFGNTMKALGTFITPVRLAMVGVAGSAAILVKAMLDGQKEAYEFSRAIALTGNAAGTTKDELADMAAEVDNVVGTQRAAAATLAQLVSTGRVQAQNLRHFAEVANQLERIGEPVDETVKKFAELGRRPVEAALKLNETMHFLTIETYQQIKALEQQGRLTEAGEAAQKAFSDASKQRAKKIEEELGTLQKAAKGTGDAFKEMWDFLLDVGREETIGKRIAELEKMQASGRKFTSGFGLISDELARLRARKQAADDAAAAEAKLARAVQDRLERERKAGNISEALTGKFEQAARSRLEADLGQIQRSLDASLSGYKTYSSALEALRAADLVDEKDYFAAKRSLVEQESKAKVDALRREQSRLEAESKRLSGAKEAAGAAALKTGSQADAIKAELPFAREITQTRERLLEIEAEIRELRKESGGELARVNTDEIKSINERTAALREAQQAADDYIASLQRQDQRNLEGVGRGGRAREMIEARNALDDRFQSERRQLERERSLHPQTSDRVEAELRILEDTYSRALVETDNYYAALEEKQGNFTLGARAALESYADSAANVAGSTEEAFTRAFSKAEDAIVKFAQTGKLSGRELAESLIADLLRIQLRAALAKVASSFDLGSILGLFGGVASTGGTGAGSGTVPTSGGPLYADVGIRRVPRDNQLAILHKDEAVIPKAMNPFAGGSGIGGKNVSIFSPVTVAAGVTPAQVDAVVKQRNAELKNEILEGLYRDRYAI